ncbi:MAG: hypothetical protein JWM11_6111 [Planctomycetaceae bacterium]|nr:hypothetical protein [Planctomycetaceae bacterium]
MQIDLREVDPRELRVPPSWPQGADPGKLQRLQRQISKFGACRIGMPPIWVFEALDGVLVIYNGVTRATRIAKLAPGTTVTVEVIGQIRKAHSNSARIGELLP